MKISYSRQPIGYIGSGPKIPTFLTNITANKQPKWLKFLNRYPNIKQELKFFLRPIIWLLDYRSTFIYWFVDGYIQRQIGCWIRRYVKRNSMVCEIGVGGGKLLKYIARSGCHYVGFDIYDISPVAFGRRIQLFIASVEDIPLPDSSVDYIVSTEVFEHIPNFEKAGREMYRILKPSGQLIVSIPNIYSNKYDRKGPDPTNRNQWHYQEFIDLLAPQFRVIEGRMKGWWLPFFPRIRYSLQVPYSQPAEYYNTNFFFVFESLKYDRPTKSAN